MTVFEIERLVRKISDALAEETRVAIAPKLAEDFATACHATNLRLQQCEAMIKAGDDHQAIQLAETQPNLLDCVTVLEFPSADDWRSYCTQNGFPPAEKIDALSVHALNQCYGRGITTNHPLYADYRRAVLSRNDEEALKALQSITRLNLADSNAASELARLDAKVLQSKLQHLAVSLRDGTRELLVAEIEAIEAFGFKNRPGGQTWRSAQGTRCGVILDEVANLKRAGRWLDSLAKLDFIRRLRSEFDLDLSSESLQAIETLQSWASSEQEKDNQDRKFQGLLRELNHKLHQSEEKDTSARDVKLGEMKDDCEGMHKVWRSLADFTRPIPSEIGAAFRKRVSLLEAEIARRTRIRQRSAIAGFAAVLLIGGLASWFALAHFKARSLRNQLVQAVGERQVHTVQKLLGYINGEEKHLLGLGGLNTAVGRGEGFISKELSLSKNFEESISKLPKDLKEEPTAEFLSRTADELATTQTRLAALAADLKAENEPRVAAFSHRWRKFVSESSSTINEILERTVSTTEKQSQELDYRLALEQARPRLTAISNGVHKIAAMESSFTNSLEIRGDLLQRASALKLKFRAYQREFDKLDNGLSSLHTARSVKDYNSALDAISSSEFSTSPLAKSALRMRSLNPSDEASLRLLLAATNASVWSLINKDEQRQFRPEAVMPAERSLIQTLRSDPSLSWGHQHVRLWLDREGKKTVDWITVGGFEKSEGWKQIKTYVPAESIENAIFSERDYGCFGGEFKLSATQPIYRVEQVKALRDTEPFFAVGLEKLLPPGADSYDHSLLEVIDAVKNSRDGSPLVRAYLILRLVEILEMQPEASGLVFTPSLKRHVVRIREICDGQLSSGDWFITQKTNRWAEKLEAFFATIRTTSYTQQATGLLALCHEVAKTGFQYVGFADLEGIPSVFDNSSTGEMCAYSAKNGLPILMASASGSQETSDDRPMSLSPIFRLKTNRRDLFTKLSINPESPSFLGVLPPLFSDGNKKQ